MSNLTNKPRLFDQMDESHMSLPEQDTKKVVEFPGRIIDAATINRLELQREAADSEYASQIAPFERRHWLAIAGAGVFAVGLVGVTGGNLTTGEGLMKQVHKIEHAVGIDSHANNSFTGSNGKTVTISPVHP